MCRRDEGWVQYAGINLVSGGAMKIFDAIRTCSLHGVRPYNFEAAIFGDGLKACEWVDLHVAANLIFCGVAGAAGSGAAPLDRYRRRPGPGREVLLGIAREPPLVA
jgi:hypothetical protein